MNKGVGYPQQQPQQQQQQQINWPNNNNGQFGGQYQPANNFANNTGWQWLVSYIETNTHTSMFLLIYFECICLSIFILGIH